MKITCPNLPCMLGFIGSDQDVCPNCHGTGIVDTRKLKGELKMQLSKTQLLKVYDTLEDAKADGYEKVPHSHPIKYRLAIPTHNKRGKEVVNKIKGKVGKTAPPKKPNNNIW